MLDRVSRDVAVSALALLVSQLVTRHEHEHGLFSFQSPRRKFLLPLDTKKQPLVVARWRWRCIRVGFAYALVFGDHLSAQQQQRRRQIQAQQYRDCRRQ